MATLSDISDLDSGVVSSEATPESHTTPTSIDDKVVFDKKEAISGGALEELVSSAVTAASKEIQQPKQNSDISSTVENDDDEIDDENYEMIQEPDSDISIITISEEHTPTRDVREGSEEIKGEVGNTLEEIPVPSKALSSHEAVEDVFTDKSSNDQEVVGENVALSAITLVSQELTEGEVVSSASVLTVETTPVNDKDVDIDVKESEPQSLESFAIISDNSLNSSTFADNNTNIESIKEPVLDAETLNEPSQKAIIISETNQEAEVIFDTPQEAENVHILDNKILNDSDHNIVSVTEPIKDVEIINDSAKESVTIEPDSSIESETLVESPQVPELVKGSSHAVESISELNEESGILSELAQDNQNDTESVQVSTSSISTTLTKVEQDKDGECYEMISDPDSGVVTPESSVITPTSEEIVVPPPPPPVEEAGEVKEEVKEEVVEQVITSGVAAAVEAAAAASEPQPTPAAKVTTTEATPSTTAASANTNTAAAAAASTTAAASSTTSESSKTSAPKSEAKVAEPSKPSTSSIKSPTTTTTVAKVNTANQLDEDDDDDEDFDESLSERIWGLTEMFPDSLRSGSINTVNATLGFLKGTYEMSRSVVWIAVSSSLLLFAPVMFELERINVEEMMKQDRNRLVLGPGSAMSGSPAPGLMPGPAR